MRVTTGAPISFAPDAEPDKINWRPRSLGIGCDEQEFLMRDSILDLFQINLG